MRFGKSSLQFQYALLRCCSYVIHTFSSHLSSHVPPFSSSPSLYFAPIFLSFWKLLRERLTSIVGFDSTRARELHQEELFKSTPCHSVIAITGNGLDIKESERETALPALPTSLIHARQFLFSLSSMLITRPQRETTPVIVQTHGVQW